MERSYSIIIKPPEEVSEDIRKKAYKVSNWTKLNPHITLLTTIMSENTDFVDRVADQLQTIPPFIFTLNRVSSINPPRVVFLTSCDQVERKIFDDLYSDVKFSLGEGIRIAINKGPFMPHLTLGFFPTKPRMKEAKSHYNKVFDNPIPLLIKEVEVTQRVGDQRWRTIANLKIGNQEEPSILLTEIYRFGENNRASIYA
ncbi:MAG: 2'-5' RNA ligase family protein [Candidatus Shapirobacteria bacterium]|nr:2'-5' RNA ligase family protein [Candidatus Shapirobacteria bacterium]